MAANTSKAATRTLRLLAALATLSLAGPLLAGGTQAQTTAPPSPAPTTPGAEPTRPGAETPPGGVARGVIEPRQNRDPEAVLTPPSTGSTMPVIPPPGTAPGSRVEPK